LAQGVVDAIVEKLNLSAAECETDEDPTAGGDVGQVGQFIAAQRVEHPEFPSIEHLAQLYGSRLPDMLAEANNRPELRARIGNAGDIAAQIVFAVREEMALRLADVVMRRTCMGQVGAPPREALESASRIMAAELGWNEERRMHEIGSLAPWFRTREAA
jgi:glycerol-3-phosphate dehydrogenase